jgi:uncharacterized OB-fold protein
MEHDWLVVDELAPSTQGALAPLYVAAGAGNLVMPFCSKCGQPLELEQGVCDACGAGAAWRPVEPAGVVHAVTTVHRKEPTLIRADAPYHIVDVELRSGHRVVMTTHRAVAEPPAIGDAVVIRFRTVGGVSVPAAAPTPHRDKEVPR